MLQIYWNYFKALRGNKKGQGMVEYGLIIALIAVACIAALGFLGPQISALFDTVRGHLTTTTTP